MFRVSLRTFYYPAVRQLHGSAVSCEVEKHTVKLTVSLVLYTSFSTVNNKEMEVICCFF